MQRTHTVGVKGLVATGCELPWPAVRAGLKTGLVARRCHCSLVTEHSQDMHSGGLAAPTVGSGQACNPRDGADVRDRSDLLCMSE